MHKVFPEMSQVNWTVLEAIYGILGGLHALWWLISLALFVRRRHHSRIANCGVFLTIAGGVVGFFSSADLILHIVLRRWPCSASMWAINLGLSTWVTSALLRGVLVTRRYSLALSKAQFFADRFGPKPNANDAAGAKGDVVKRSSITPIYPPSLSTPSIAKPSKAYPYSSSCLSTQFAPASLDTPLAVTAHCIFDHPDPAWTTGSVRDSADRTIYDHAATIQKQKFRASERRINRWFLMSFTFFLAWSAFAQVFTKRNRLVPEVDWSDEAELRCSFGWENFPTVLLCVGYLMIATPIQWYKLRSVHDAYRIKSGLIANFVAAYPCFILYFIWTYYLEKVSPVILLAFPASLWTIIAGTVNHGTCVFIPLCCSYIADRQKRKGVPATNFGQFPYPGESAEVISPASAPSIPCVSSTDFAPLSVLPSTEHLTRTMECFRYVLETKPLFEEFKRAAIADFNVENPLFYEEYTSFRDALAMYHTHTKQNPHPQRQPQSNGFLHPNVAHGIGSDAAEPGNLEAGGSVTRRRTSVTTRSPTHINLTQETPALPPWLRRKAKRMYTAFIAADAPLMLNLPSRIRDPIVKQFLTAPDEISGDVFFDVAEDVLWTMFSNTFVKFLEQNY